MSWGSADSRFIEQIIEQVRAQGTELTYTNGQWTRHEFGMDLPVPTSLSRKLDDAVSRLRLIEHAQSTLSEQDLANIDATGVQGAVNRFGANSYEYRPDDPQGHNWRYGSAAGPELEGKYIKREQANKLDWWRQQYADRRRQQIMEQRQGAGRREELPRHPEVEAVEIDDPEREPQGDPQGGAEEVPEGEQQPEGTTGGGGTGAEGGRRPRGNQPWWNRVGRYAGGFGGIGAAGGIAAALGAGQQLASRAVQTGAGMVQSVTGWLERTLEQAMSAAGGATGAGASRIAGGVAHLLTSGLQIGASAAVGLGGALLDATATGLRAAGGIAIMALGGAVIGVMAGAFAAVGTTIADSLGRALGAAAEAAEAALHGVVMILRDLTSTGREFGNAGQRMRSIGGVQAGQDMNLLMYGQAVGMNTGEMSNFWGRYNMRPEIARGMMAAGGVQYDGGNLPGTMNRIADSIEKLPAMIQLPMANAMTGGQGEAIMRLVALGRDQREAAARLPQEMGLDPQALSRMYQGLTPDLNRIAALTAAIKVEALDATLPIIRNVLQGTYRLWQEHRGQVTGFIQKLPELIGTGLKALAEGGIGALKFLESIYLVLRDVWNWLNKVAIPAGKSFLGGLFGGESDGAGGPAGASGAGGGGGFGFGGRGGRGLGPTADPAGADRWRQRGETFRRVGQFAMDHPILTAAGLLLGPGLIQSGLRAGGGALLRAAVPAAAQGATGTAATWMGRLATGPVGRFAASGAGRALGAGAVGFGLGWGAAGRNWQTPTRRVLGVGGSILAGAGAGLLMGGVAGAVIGGGAAVVGAAARPWWDARQDAQRNAAQERQVRGAMRNVGYLDGRSWALEHGYTEKQFDETGLSQADSRRWRADRAAIGRPSGGVAGRAADPVLTTMRNAQSQLQRFIENLPNLMKQSMVEAQQQQRAQLDMNVKIQPSAEFAAQMEYQQSLAMLRSVQLAVS